MPLLGVGAPSLSVRYSTSFPNVENPISESGNWTNGGATGIDWRNCRVSQAGRCIGDQDHTTPNYYSDSTAVLSGTWANNQQVEAVVYRVGGNTNEVELRLRTIITANSITGYEILFNHEGMQIVRWNGPVADFTVIGSGGTGGVDGDIVKASMIGTTIRAYVNGTEVASVTDATYASGQPGIGFFQSDSDISNNLNFGFKSFLAMEL